MNHQADRLFLPDNVHGTRFGDARSSGVNAGQLHREKIDFVCLDGRATKSSNHSNPVTAVTDSYSFALIMCGYSAGSIFEFAAGSPSTEIQVDSRPSLNRANFPGRSPKFRKLEMCRKRQPTSGSITNKEFCRSNWCNKHRVLTHSSISENDNQRVSALPASGSIRI
jgi:hypothetical protein